MWDLVSSQKQRRGSHSARFLCRGNRTGPKSGSLCLSPPPPPAPTQLKPRSAAAGIASTRRGGSPQARPLVSHLDREGGGSLLPARFICADCWPLSRQGFGLGFLLPWGPRDKRRALFFSPGLCNAFLLPVGEAGFLEGPFGDEAQSGLKAKVALDNFLAAFSDRSLSRSNTVSAKQILCVRNRNPGKSL